MNVLVTGSKISEKIPSASKFRPAMESLRVRKLQSKILRWYSRHQRILPWRADPTPYHVWISEIMLQQTQVKTAIPYYDRFLERFPDLQALARASEQEVLELWSGLGYYRRARNLHRAAQIMVGRYGAFPEEARVLRTLPGIGRYTAGAICSIAFHQDQPAVDGNIRRVLARLNGIQKHAPESYFWKQMECLLPKNQASSFNQAMMEVGALICTPAQPQCPICPVKTECAARKMGIQNTVPVIRSRRKPESVDLLALVLEHRGRLLVTSLFKPEIIPGEWGFPCRIAAGSQSAATLAELFCRTVLKRKIALTPQARFRHSITHYRITIHIFCGTIIDPVPRILQPDRHRWLMRHQIQRQVLSSLFRKVLQKCEERKFDPKQQQNLPGTL